VPANAAHSTTTASPAMRRDIACFTVISPCLGADERSNENVMIDNPLSEPLGPATPDPIVCNDATHRRPTIRRDSRCIARSYFVKLLGGAPHQGRVTATEHRRDEDREPTGLLIDDSGRFHGTNPERAHRRAWDRHRRGRTPPRFRESTGPAGRPQEATFRRTIWRRCRYVTYCGKQPTFASPPKRPWGQVV
jgi:hypothetical protein